MSFLDDAFSLMTKVGGIFGYDPMGAERNHLVDVQSQANTVQLTLESLMRYIQANTQDPAAASTLYNQAASVRELALAAKSNASNAISQMNTAIAGGVNFDSIMQEGAAFLSNKLAAESYLVEAQGGLATVQQGYSNLAAKDEVGMTQVGQTFLDIGKDVGGKITSTIPYLPYLAAGAVVLYVLSVMPKRKG